MAHYRKRCLTVLLTDECNLECKYCYCKDSKEIQKDININFVKRAILDFYKKEGNLYVRFFGDGEPTLKKNMIKVITEFCKKIDVNAKFELQTNGTFDSEFCDWIAENINIIWISYDGTTEVNDFYRVTKDGKKVSEIVERNINYLAKTDRIVGVRTTIGRKNVDLQKEIIFKMKELGIKYIYSDLMFADIENKSYYETPVSHMEYADKFILAREYAKSFGIKYESFFTINFDEEIDIFCRACIPMPHLTTDNYISCCDMGYQYDERFDELFYAKYDEKNDVIVYDEKKIDYIAKRKVDLLEDCEGCIAKYHCAGGCIGEAINEQGTIYSIKKQNCEAIRYIFGKIGAEYTSVNEVLHP